MIKLVIRSDGQEKRGRSSGKKRRRGRSGLAHNRSMRVKREKKIKDGDDEDT
jgi:hypothetical protein